MDSFTKLEAAVQAAKAVAEKTAKGNKSAGTSLRKAMQEVRTLAKAVRDEVLVVRKNTPPRAKKAASSES